MLATLCVGGMAMAETERAPDLAGRWVAEKPKLVLDLSRCGAGWCGVEVADGACGRTVLRVAVTAADRGRDTFQGRLERAAAAQSYAVEVDFARPEPNGPVGLIIFGNSGDKIEPWRRTFPFRAVFARTGDSQCTPDPKTS